MLLGSSRMGDERLARLVGDGSERAFAVLYERYHRPLYRYCRSMLRDDLDAQDAVQSTFAGVFAALRDRRRTAPVRPWLFRIAHNEAISILRRARVRGEARPPASPAVGASAEEHAANRERLAQLVADLHELPERQRGALLMRELAGLSHIEISLALEISTQATKSAIFAARQGLTEFAEGREMACEEIERAISDGDRSRLRRRPIRAHLRDCPACATFAAGVRSRPADLRALAPPLAPVASVALLAHISRGVGTGAPAGSGAVSAGTGGTIAGAGASAGKLAGGLLASKALVGAVVVVGAAVSVAGISVLEGSGRRTRSQAASAGGGSGRSAKRVLASAGARALPGAGQHGSRSRSTRSRRRGSAGRSRGHSAVAARSQAGNTRRAPRTRAGPHAGSPEPLGGIERALGRSVRAVRRLTARLASPLRRIGSAQGALLGRLLPPSPRARGRPSSAPRG